MKRLSLSSEILLWVLMLVPLVYLAFAWDRLPEQVPIHFDLEGEPNGWASKLGLVGIILFTTVGVNLLLLLILAIDPKNRLGSMGEKYHTLRVILVLFMSALAMLIIYSAASGDGLNPNIMLVALGALFAALGNYFQAIKPNYFIGIRTPWTLESETVWRKTHRIGGRLWIGGGILMALLPLIPDESLRRTVFIGIVAVIVLIPVAYSFIEFRKERVAH